MNRADVWMSLEAGDDAGVAARAEWLERALVGLDLATVISELTAIAGKPAASSGTSAESARSWLGRDATVVLRKGLGSLPARKIDDLFRNPELLAGLQELVLTEGGAHWDARVRRNDVTDKLAARQRHRIAGRLGMDTTKAPDAAAGIPLRAMEPPRQPDGGPSTDRGRQFRRLVSIALPLTLAAAAVVALIPVWRQRIAGDRAVPELGGVTVVSVMVPETTAGQEDPARRDADAVGGESWPEHPWKTMIASAPDGGGILPERGNKSLAVPSKKLLTDSRQWSRQLEGTRHLTSNQVRVAVERARGAIMAIDGLASEGALDLGDYLTTRLRAKCRVAMGELNHVDTMLDRESTGGGGMAQARRNIVRVLGDVESALEADLKERGAPDASAP